MSEQLHESWQKEAEAGSHSPARSWARGRSAPAAPKKALVFNHNDRNEKNLWPASRTRSHLIDLTKRDKCLVEGYLLKIPREDPSSPFRLPTVLWGAVWKWGLYSLVKTEPKLIQLKGNSVCLRSCS